MAGDQLTYSASDVAFWRIDQNQIDSLVREGPDQRVYDLEERTARFGERIITFAKKIPKTAVNVRLITQLVGAGTSIGANYCEADDAVSRADFKCRIGTSRKESRETKFFLRMVATAEPSLKQEAKELWLEADSLHKIFSRIWRNTNV